ncbi:MAG: zf-TFIIB domain-containing protein [Candidatus Pacebacteria bacterium]|nr:zf-TFIIB domain-containing protein [Candidatus Paceibacterota bacterium]
MKCPTHQEQEMKKAMFYNTQVDYCPICLGVWFTEDELRQAKDQKDKTLQWLDVDLWSEATKFQVEKTPKVCPVDSVPLYQVNYNHSNIKVDICDFCRGVWLDRGEFKKIINYLQGKKVDEILHHYLKSFVEEGKEIFIGPETFKEEVDDFMAVVKLFKDKLLVQHPALAIFIANLPK